MLAYLVAVGALLLRWRLVWVLIVGRLALPSLPLRLIPMPILWRLLMPVLRRWRSSVLLWRVLLLAGRWLLILRQCRQAPQ